MKPIIILQRNQETIAFQSEKIEGKFKKLDDNFYFLMRSKNIMDQIETSINIIMVLIE